MCYFSTEYPVNMTDEEWLQGLEKNFQFWSSSFPPYVHMVGGKEGCTFATVKCLLLVEIWPFFLCDFNFSCSWRHCIQISQIRVWSERNDATSDNWVLPIIKCPPVTRLENLQYGNLCAIDYEVTHLIWSVAIKTHVKIKYIQGHILELFTVNSVICLTS